MRTPPLSTAVALAFALVGWSPSEAAAQNPAPDPTPLLTRSADALITVLKSDAGLKEKTDACRELSVVGGAQALPALLPLLADDQLNHMARYALETMPEPGINEALRAQLPKLQGRSLAGLIATLGVRRDSQAVAPVGRFLHDPNPAVAHAAARALARIGTPEAASAIQAALPAATADTRLALEQSWLESADAVAIRGPARSALALYDQMLAMTDLTAPVRLGALRGALLTRGSADTALLAESLRSSDYTVFATAVEAAASLRESAVTQLLARNAANLDPDRQILLAQALARRGAETVPTLASIAESGARPAAAAAAAPAAARLAATRALAESDHPSALPVLLRLLREQDRDIRSAAQDGIAALSSKNADAAILRLAKSSAPDDCLAGIALIGMRRMSGAVPTLLAATRNSDAAVRRESFARWGELAAPADAPAFVRQLLQLRESADLAAAEQALAALCGRADNPKRVRDAVLSALSRAQPQPKIALIGVLGVLGSDQSLPAMRAALADAPEIRAAAVTALAAWPDASAMPELLRLTESAADSERLQALRGYVRLAGEAKAPPAEKLGWLRSAGANAKSAAETRVVLAGVGELASPEALAFAASYLSNPALADEAGAAAVRIAAKLSVDHKQAIGAALKQVVAAAKSKTIVDQARHRMTELGIAP